MINELAEKVYNNSHEKGFYENPVELGTKIAMIHGEVSEMLEADREDRYCLVNIAGVMKMSDENFVSHYRETVKGTFEEEAADIMLRVLDLCRDKKIDIQNHMLAKHRFNTFREKYHGKKY